MATLRRSAWFLSAIILLNVDISHAALVWRPGEGWADESGGEVSASSSRDQLQFAKTMEEKQEYDAAYKAYKGLVRKWPLSFYAPEAQFKAGLMEEKKADFWRAYKSYQRMVEKYPNSSFFEQALERQFEIGNLYLAGEPQRLWKIPMGASMEKTIQIFEQVIKNAPYGKYAAESQFKIGLANERQKKFAEAVKAYNSIIDKYPGNDIVDDAAYQIGYSWLRASSEPDYDQSAAQKSVEAFQDFLVKYPNSSKAVQAKENIAQLEGRRTQGSFNIASFYEGQGNLKAAYIYYNDVLRESPGSEQAQLAKKKIDELRPKVEKELNLPPLSASAEKQAENPTQPAGTNSNF
jgi:outer membrane protein assembly factor BamD